VKVSIIYYYQYYVIIIECVIAAIGYYATMVLPEIVTGSFPLARMHQNAQLLTVNF